MSIIIYNPPDARRRDTFKGTAFTITVNELPLDLTGASIKMSLKLSKELTTSALDLSTVNGRIVIQNPTTDGKFNIVPQIIDVPAGTYWYAIQITLSDLSVHTYVEGRWKILQDVTI